MKRRHEGTTVGTVRTEDYSGEKKKEKKREVVVMAICT